MDSVDLKLSLTFSVFPITLDEIQLYDSAANRVAGLDSVA